jgi:dTDP-4-amino-4,6-dideoxygalactose transaminase
VALVSDWVVPLSDVRFTEEEIDAVASTYRSGWLSQGPKVAAFESAFAGHTGGGHAVAVANGTAALQLICAGLEFGKGQEVILPSLTFAATAAAVVHSGATPKFADIGSPGEPWLSADAAGQLIGPRTRAIISVAYAGHPGEINALRELADAHGLALIEDAAHALGAWLGNQPVGSFGHAAAFSFFANKNMALGEGGMALTREDELAKRMRLLRSHGLTADTRARHTGVESEYDVLEPGFNFRLDEARAALGLLLLDRLRYDNDLRAVLVRRYAAALQAIDGVSPAITFDYSMPASAGSAIVSAWHIFPLLLEPGIDRRRFREHLTEAGVQTSIHYPPLHLTKAFAAMARGPLPVTEDYARRSVTIPLFPHMTEAQQGRVIDAVAAAVGEAR